MVLGGVILKLGATSEKDGGSGKGGHCLFVCFFFCIENPY